jgi:hypothetical protein
VTDSDFPPTLRLTCSDSDRLPRYLTYNFFKFSFVEKVRRVRQMRGGVQQYFQKTQKNFYRTFVTLCLIRLIRLTFKYNPKILLFPIQIKTASFQVLLTYTLPFPPNRDQLYLTYIFSSFKRIYIEYKEYLEGGRQGGRVEANNTTSHRGGLIYWKSAFWLPPFHCCLHLNILGFLLVSC